MTVYRVTKDGVPQGREYESATEASTMSSMLAALVPDATFNWIAVESDKSALEEDWIERALSL